MWSQYAVVYASVTLSDVGAGLLELRAGHCAFKRGITPSVKTYQGNINLHEHVKPVFHGSCFGAVSAPTLYAPYPRRKTGFTAKADFEIK